MLELNDTLIIGKGSERLVYQHPHNSDLCIKIRYRVKRSRNESINEFEYTMGLKGDVKSIPLALPSEWVITNLGQGLVFPLIRDDDGNISPLLKQYRHQEKVSDLMDDFEHRLMKHAISVTDIQAQNIVVQTIKGKSRLVLIDGYGFTNQMLKHIFVVTRAITRMQTKRRIEKLKKRYFGYA